MRLRRLDNGVFCKDGVWYFRYLAYWFLSLLAFWLCEILIESGDCHVVSCYLDTLIPFCEAFVIFYVLWYFLIAFSLVYFGVTSRESFRALLLFLTVCQLVAIVIFLIYPSKQLLRPEAMPRDNPLTRLVSFIYSVDTNTNVCPSLHVAFSLAMISAWCRDRQSPALLRCAMVVLSALAAASTVFVKQHSIIDVFTAVVMCAAVEAVLNHDFWKELFTKLLKTERKSAILPKTKKQK